MPIIFLTSLLTLFQIINAVTVLQLPTEITDVVSMPVGIQAVLSLVWASAFFLVTVRLFRQQPNAKRTAFWLIIGFMFYTGLRWALFARADYDRARLPFLTGIIVIVGLLLAWGILRSGQNGQMTGEGKQDGDESIN